MVEKKLFLVHCKTEEKEILDACLEIILQNEDFSIHLHGLETGQPKALAIANTLTSKYPDRFETSVYSSSIDLIDKLYNIAKEIEKEGLKHTCSAIHIEIKSKKNV